MSMDEFAKAFNEDRDSAAAEQEQGKAVQAAMQEPKSNPSADSAEGATESDAAAVVLAEGSPDDPGQAELDPQREKSWEGRLRVKEEALDAREAELAAKEQALAAASQEAGLMQAKNGAEVDTEGGAEEGSDTAEPSLLDELRNEAMSMAQDPVRMNTTLEGMVEDFGHEQVVLMLALASPMIEMMAGPHVLRLEERINAVQGNVDESVNNVIASMQENFDRMHASAIADVHEDFMEIVESPEFQGWLDSLGDKKAEAETLLNEGSPGQVVKLLQRFKDSREAGKKTGPTPEDIWAEDAAAGVKGSAPVAIPKKTASSPNDEYSAAWAAL